MGQLILNFPYTPDYSPENYMPLSFNAEAFRALAAFPAQKSDVLVVYGASGSGKSHLLNVWTKLKQAQLLCPGSMPVHFAAKHWALDDLHKLNGTDQEHLFHLFNHITAHGGALMVTSAVPTAQLDILPDLKSRLLLGNQVALEQPTEAELKLLLAKWAMDRQLTFDPAVVNYILTRCGRSPALLQQILVSVDAASMVQKRPVTIPLVKAVLEDFDDQGAL